ncbi:MAG: extracellular solute-binding protein [Armatimonadetes bacterium]|nr:extracellular solute-binding protein [Armatimonadota bacterium]
MKAIWVLLAMALVAVCPAKSIRFWAVTGSSDDIDLYRKLAVNFEKQSGIRVEVTPLAWGNFESKYFTAMAAGEPPDAGATNLGGPFNYGTVGGLVDLKNDYPDLWKQVEPLYSPKLFPMFSVGDKVYGVPSDIGALVLMYRKDIFSRLGIKPPETWSELDRAIQQLEANHYRYYFGWTLGAQWSLGMYTMPFGQPGISTDSSGKVQISWDNPDYQKGVLKALDLWYCHDSPGRDLGSRTVGMFGSDEPGLGIPLLIDLHSTAGQIRHLAPKLAGKWDVLPWPTADTGKPYHVMGGITFVIFRKSDRHRESYQWIKYLSSLEAQKLMFAERFKRPTDPQFTISGVKSMWQEESDDFWKQPQFAEAVPMREVLKKVYFSLGTLPMVQGTADISRLESNMLDQMKSWIDDRLLVISRNHGLTRAELVAAFGSGKYQNERAEFYQKLSDKVRDEYARILPEAKVLSAKAEEIQVRRTDTILKHLPEYEKSRNVLDVLKLFMGLAIAVGVASVCFHPKLKRHRLSYFYIATPLVLAMVFVFIPALTALYVSFTEYHPVLPLSTATWTGMSNYQQALTSPELLGALTRTIKYVVMTLPVGICLSLCCAMLLNSKPKGDSIWRFLYLSPLVTSAVSIALIFTQLFMSSRQGWMNSILMGLNLTREPLPFLTSERTFLDCVIVLAIWHGIAFTTIVFLAGLQQIPAQLFEAAVIDGAKPVTRLWHVVLPGIRPQMFFISVLGVIGAFQVFETVFLMANKSGDAAARFGPNDSGLTMVPLIYNKGFETMQMGLSSAIAYILFVAVLALTAIQFRVFNRKEVSA